MPRTHDGESIPEYSPDATVRGADWTKQSWDFPPYKSADFLESIGGVEQLPAFRTTSAYLFAVERGIIHDDEWILDWCTPTALTEPMHKDDDEHVPGKPRKGNVRIHLHRGK
jgi:hypothetical protein